MPEKTTNILYHYTHTNKTYAMIMRQIFLTDFIVVVVLNSKWIGVILFGCWFSFSCFLHKPKVNVFVFLWESADFITRQKKLRECITENITTKFVQFFFLSISRCSVEAHFLFVYILGKNALYIRDRLSGQTNNCCSGFEILYSGQYFF